MRYLVEFKSPLFRGSDKTHSTFKIVEGDGPIKSVVELVAKQDMTPESWHFPVKVWTLPEHPATFRVSSDLRVVQVNE